jgi:F-type H+-transporting ATPase subunit k
VAVISFNLVNIWSCSVIFGRAIKNEYLALGTIGATIFGTMAAMGGKKEATTKPTTIEQVKEAVKFNAGSRYVYASV